MERVRSPRFVFVCLLIACTAAQRPVFLQASSQQLPTPTPPPPTQPERAHSAQAQPTFRVGATFVRVDAFVTRDGKPVTDLTADDFDVFEDGVKQTIKNFEFVNIPNGAAQNAPRSDPQTVADMREKVADPRRRVFVLFVDTYHIRQGASMWSRKAFQRFLERMIGPDDLIAGVTPEMSPDSLAFGSHIESLNSFLDTIFGRRDSVRQNEDEEWMQSCFGTLSREGWEQIRERRRSKLSLDALEGVVAQVGGMRDERKAIITVTEGWTLYREDLKLAQDPSASDTNRPIHTGPIINRPGGAYDPLTGRSAQGGPNSGDCDRVRMELANMETAQQFHDLPFVANRANASFYVIDPRGLAASDDLLGPNTVVQDQQILKNKLEQMRELADRTDGMALLHSNDLDKELTRIADDLSSYYLLGYDSTNGKLDGSYRALTVKVKRPGVLVRARRGYNAATLPSAGSSKSRSGGTAPSATASTTPAENEITNAVNGIMGGRSDLPVRLRATAVRLLPTTSGAADANGSSAPTSELRIVAEVDARLAASDAWRQGGTAHLIVRGEGSAPSLSADATLVPGSRILTATIPLAASLPPGPYHVQMRLNAQTRTDALSDATTVQVSAPALIASPALLRRGPSTGTAYVATADTRFRRADRLRLEAPSRLPATQVRVTAVDQRGQPLNLPIQVTDRQDAGATVIVADVSLAPLAPGGYAVVLTTGDQRVIVPVQIVP